MITPEIQCTPAKEEGTFHTGRTVHSPDLLLYLMSTESRGHSVLSLNGIISLKT